MDVLQRGVFRVHRVRALQGDEAMPAMPAMRAVRASGGVADEVREFDTQWVALAVDVNA
jgi:hypothetical protein